MPISEDEAIKENSYSVKQVIILLYKYIYIIHIIIFFYLY